MRKAFLPLVLSVVSASALAQQNYPTPPSGDGFPIYPDGRVIQSESRQPARAAVPAVQSQSSQNPARQLPVASVEGRLANIERQLQARGQLDLLRQVSEVRNEVSRLQGLLDEQQYKVQRLEQRQRDLFKDLDQRLSRLRDQFAGGAVSKVASPAPVAVPAPVALPSASPLVSSPVAAATPAAPAASGDRSAYDKAYQLVSDGKYGEALLALDSYLQQFPAGEYRANAYYWQGQIFYLNRQLAEAEVAYQSVLKQYASHSKAADSMLKLAIVKVDLKQVDQAASLFNQVISSYPDSSAARLAKQHLAKLPR